MNGYLCYYRGDHVEVMAPTTYAAQQEALAKFQRKFPRRKIRGSEISVSLAEVDGKPYIQTAVD